MIKNKIGKAVKVLCKYHNENLRACKDKQIYVGRVFTLGPMFQYFLARELFKNTQYKVLVDCPVTIKSRGQALYPDILVVENGTLKGIIDVKLDLGYVKPERFGFKLVGKGVYRYNRKGNEFLKLYKSFFKSSKFAYKIRNEYNEVTEKKEVKIPKRIKKTALILMGNVNHHDRYDGYKKAMEDADFKFCHILWNSNVRKPKKCSMSFEKEIAENTDIEKTLRWL